MCRITAAISTKAVPNRDLLCGPEAAGGRQGGAWGIGYYRGGKPMVVRSQGPALPEEQAFKKTAPVSRVAIASFRGGSAPEELPGKRPAGKTGAQPFSACGLLFAHNGSVLIKEEIKTLLGKYASRLKGKGAGDSEILFWQAVKMMDAYGSPATALEMALDEIRTVWLSCKSKYPGENAPYRGLNMFLASRDSLAVLRHFPGNGKKGAPPARDPECGRVAWRREKGRVVFTNGPTDERTGWKKMKDAEIAAAGLRGGGIELSLKRISL